MIVTFRGGRVAPFSPLHSHSFERPRIKCGITGRDTAARMLAVIGVALLPVAVHAQNPPRITTAQAVARVQALNTRMVEVLAAPASDRSRVANLTDIGGARFQLLAAIVDDAPGDVVRLALSSARRDSLPAEARVLTEERVDLAGTVEVTYEDYRGFSRLRHMLDTGLAKYSLHFEHDPPGWMTGDRIRVRGVRVGAAVAVGADSLSALSASSTSSDASTSASTSPLAGASGEQRTLMILVNFRDNPVQPYTPAQAHDMMFATTDGYFRDASFGAAWLTGDVLGWFTINLDSTVCYTSTLATLAKQAATGTGANLSNYSRFVYAFPGNACSWWGLGSVGGNPSQAWINGDLALDVTGHELGHNVGLYHSRNMDCGAVPIGSTCTVDEYGDTLDLMGATRGHFNTFQKERLGWLAAGQILTVTSGGTYAIEPFETPTSGVKALKILKSVDPTTGKRTFYYVELRKAIGYDAFMSGWSNVMNGVAIHTGSESGGNTTYLLDMTPETASWYDPALVSARTFSDATAGVSVTTISISATGATVSVSLSPSVVTCTQALPTVTLSPGTPSAVPAGTMVNYAVTVANTDSAACPTSTFTLSPGVPTGWSVTLDLSSIAVAAGGSASTTLHATAPTGTPGGSYPLSVRAVDTADSTHAGSGSATYTVAEPPSVWVSTDRASYARGSTVLISATVTSGSAPLGGVTVSFQIRKPDGRTVNASATTDAAGMATYRLRLRNRDPLGTYQVVAAAGGSATASTSFSVY